MIQTLDRCSKTGQITEPKSKFSARTIFAPTGVRLPICDLDPFTSNLKPTVLGFAGQVEVATIMHEL